jgi:hypothetical protein
VDDRKSEERFGFGEACSTEISLTKRKK